MKRLKTTMPDKPVSPIAIPLLIGGFLAVHAVAGNPDPPSSPAPTMHTLTEIYDIADAVDPPRQALAPTASVMAAGYYDATNLAQVDADLDTENIRAGVEIFGVAGKPEVVDTSSGDAAAGDILVGKKAWVDGGEVTGMVPVGDNVTGPEGVLAISIPDGYYFGSKTATAGDSDLTADNVRAGVDLFGVAGNFNVVDTGSGDALAGDLLAGKKVWVDGAEVAGTMSNRGAVVFTPGMAQQSIPQGYHNGSGYVSGDADLTAGNIRAGVELFGVAGDPKVVDTSSGDAAAKDIVAGKKAWVDGKEIIGTSGTTPCPAPLPRTGLSPTEPQNPAPPGSDGALQKGVAWPNPRFTDNLDGTVSDNLTGLTWLKNMSALGSREWTNALADCRKLNSGEAGLSDGSVEGDWRLPNVNEVFSLIDWKYWNPALPDTAGTDKATLGNPFSGLSDWVWTSTAQGDDNAWAVCLNDPVRQFAVKGITYTVWPVRDSKEPLFSGTYFEDFSDGLAQGWAPMDTDHWAVVNGEYRAAAGTNGVCMQANYTNTVWHDFTAEATVRRTGSTSSACILMLRASPDFDYTGYPTIKGTAILVGISGVGDYFIAYHKNGSELWILSWTSSSYLNTGTNANTLRVVLAGGSIQLYLNDQLAYSGSNLNIPTSGRIALVGYSAFAGEIETIHYFDKVSVTAGAPRNLAAPLGSPSKQELDYESEQKLSTESRAGADRQRPGLRSCSRR